jgi:outer membrane beta-barrel protein
MTRYARSVFATLLLPLAVVALTETAMTGTAHAQAPGVKPLEDQVAIRHRYELLESRFEVGVGLGFTLNRAFMNAILLELRAQYHINQYISVGTNWGFGINYTSSLTGELDDTYSGDTGVDSQTVFDKKLEALSRLQIVGDVRVAFTPFYGKLGIFSSLFMNYDFYGFVGVAFGKTTNDTGDSNIDETNDQFNVGFAWGLGMHVFVTNWLSVGLEFKDLIFNDNESGNDITRGLQADEQQGCVPTDITTCRAINSDDRSFLHHFFFGFNVTFFFPMRPSIAY